MDYKTEMESKKFDFFEFYSQRMDELEKVNDIPEELSKQLQSKRIFGVEKYKEYSFQSNFENAVTSPSEDHLREELIDAINYALHSIYKSTILLEENTRQYDFLRKLVSLYNDSFTVFPPV